MKRAVSGLALFVAGICVAGCGPKTRGAVAFDGRARAPLAQPDQLVEVRDLPAGYRTLGRAAATCTLTEGSRELRGAWLSDVDCSETRLRAAVRERAAAVGGELLVGMGCHSEQRGARGEIQRTAIVCRADVARPTEAALSTRELAPPAPAVPWGEELPASGEAWRIRVDYTPSPGLQRRSPRRSDSIGELPTLPPSHRHLGDIVTRCTTGCTERGAYDGLLAAAGRMGASDVVDVGCVRQGEGWLCSAMAAGYRTDPEQDPAAR
jgi:hypothetical protein